MILFTFSFRAADRRMPHRFLKLSAMPGSVDGINFTQDPSNPIFKSKGTWNCGRAIDAEVVEFRGQYFMYFASRTPDHKNQLLGVAVASGDTDFSRGSWSEPVDKSILFPEYAWEGICIEAPSVIQVGDTLFMFYAGAYNNAPQQMRAGCQLRRNQLDEGFQQAFP
jgi:predicted GH43/DUF377 family glycosyl hydrolase